MAMKSFVRAGRQSCTRASRAALAPSTSRVAAVSSRTAVASAHRGASSITSRGTTATPVRAMSKSAFAEMLNADKQVLAENNAHREKIEDELTQYGSVDNKFEKYRIKDGNGNDARSFTYGVLGAGRFVYGGALRGVAIALIASWSASADVLAMATTEVDIGKIPEGTTATIKWRGKPVFIRHRTEREIESAINDNGAAMVDSEADEARRTDPKWLVVLGVCTHLGCVPIPNAGDYKGWFCPCHGSHYDTSGRIRKGPAPLNLEVPTYKFIDSSKLLIG